MMLDLGKRGVFDARGELLTGGKGNRNTLERSSMTNSVTAKISGLGALTDVPLTLRSDMLIRES